MHQRKNGLIGEAEALALTLLRCYERSINAELAGCRRRQLKRLTYAAMRRYFRRVEAQRGGNP